MASTGLAWSAANTNTITTNSSTSTTAIFVNTWPAGAKMPTVKYPEAEALIASVVGDPEFDKLHPRGHDGRFIEKGGFAKYLDVVSGLWRKVKVEDITSDGKIKTKRVDDGHEDVMSPSSLYAADKAKATLNPSNWNMTGKQAGSNPGGFFQDAAGTKFYVKTPSSKLHVANENLANRLYLAAGAPAPETATSPDGRRFITKIENSVAWTALSGQELTEAKKAVARDFVTDAWLANWDGPVNDNIRVTPSGVPLRVDAGGAVMFRARGGKRQLTPNVGELQTLRDPKISYSGHDLYSSVTKADEEENVKRILAISPDTIKEMVKEEGLPPQVATDLIARRAWLGTHYGFQLPETTADGQKLLAEIKAGPAAPTEAEKKDISARIVKLAPDQAVPLAIGAPVWVKDKTNGVSDGSRIPDIMIVNGLGNTDDPAASNFVWLKSQNGKVFFGNVPIADVELLRENYASPSSKYAGGESPQVGDRVNSSKNGPGTILELFPLYSRVQFDDGSTRVVRVKSMTRLAQAGTDAAKPPEGVAPTPLAKAAKIGEHMDVADPVTRFPLVAYSLPHRANVLVLDHDQSSGKASVMLGDGRRANVNDAQLYDPATVDKEAVAALPTRTPGTRAPRVKPALDVTTLPAKEFQPNRNVKVELHPGDRLLKIREKASRIHFLVVRRGIGGLGYVEYAGNSDTKRDNTVDKATGYVIPRFKDNPEQILKALDSAKPEDITPAQYDQAAHQLGATVLSTQAPEWTQVELPFERYKIPDKTSTNKYFTSEPVKTTFGVKPGDEFQQLRFPDSPVEKGYTTESYVYGGRDPKPYTAPNVLLTRNGVTYDLGLRGENAGNPDAWVKMPTEDITKIESLHDEYWYRSSGNPEPTVTLSDGRVLKYTDISSVNSGGPITRLNQRAETLKKLSGEVPANERVRWNSVFDGKTELMKWLQDNTAEWGKGAPKEPVKPLLGQSENALTRDPSLTQTERIQAKIDAAKTVVGLETAAANADTVFRAMQRQGLTSYPVTGEEPITYESLEDSLDKSLQLPDDSLKAPAPPSTPGQIPDIDSVAGFDALHHSLGTSAEKLNQGEYDEQLHKIMTADYGGKGSYGLKTISDGTTHHDPYMAEYALALDGHQQSLVVSQAVFNEIRNMTGQETLYRGVSDASFRDALKNGAHFNGHGVYGNGTYTTNRRSTSAGSYGGNVTVLTMKPGTKGVDFNQVVNEESAAISLASAQRQDALANVVPEFNMSEVRAKKFTDMPAGWQTAFKSTYDSSSGTSDRWKNNVANADMTITAMTYAGWLKREGYDVTPSWEHGYYQDGSWQLAVKDPNSKLAFTLKFGSPEIDSNTRRATGAKEKDAFVVTVSIQSKKDGSGVSNDPYSSGRYATYSEQLSELLAELDIHFDQATLDKIAQIDARIAFMKDPGRYALAAGYDYISADQGYGSGEVYYVFTHRPAMIFKK